MTHFQVDHTDGRCPPSTKTQVFNLFEHEKAVSFESLLTPSESRLKKVRKHYEDGYSYDSDDEWMEGVRDEL